MRWLFAPRSTAPLGAFRAAFGVIVLLWAVALIPDLQAFFGRDGIQPDSSTYLSGSWTLFDLWRGDAALYVGAAVLILAAAALAVGWHSRLASLVVFALVMSFQTRDIWVFNSGDLLLRCFTFLLVLTPSGAALSLDRRRLVRRRGEGDPLSAPARAPWSWRLLQVQLSLVYLFSVFDKLPGDTWRGGTAVGYALQITDLARLPAPTFLIDLPLLINLITYCTLAVETLLILGLWFRRTRGVAIAAGLALHLAIDLTLTVGFFSYVITSAYLLFVAPETIERVARRLLRSPQPQPPGDGAGATAASSEDSSSEGAPAAASQVANISA